MVSHQAARLPLACHKRHPSEFKVFPLFFAPSGVLDVCPVGIHGQHPVVSDVFKVVDLVAVHARLPVPIAELQIAAAFLCDLEHPRPAAEHGVFLLARIPQDARAHCHLVGNLRRPFLSRFVAAFPPYPEFGAGQRADGAVARRVNKKRSDKARTASVDRAAARDVNYCAVLCLRRNDACIEEQRYVRFGPHGRKLAVVLVRFGGFRIAALGRADLLDDVAYARILAMVKTPAKPDPHFG